MNGATTSVRWDVETAVDRIDIAFAGTCDMALWCKVLRDKGWTGLRIARALGRSEGYVNNLVRVVERASPAVLVRWREEQVDATHPICATDWLVQICLLPHDRQDVELATRIAAAAAQPADRRH